MSLVTHKLGVIGTHLLEAWLIKTTKRLTFQINYQAPEVTNKDVTAIKQFTATNGYDVISEHRMDIQSRRIWLLGAESDQPAIRSGTMATPVQSLCDEGFTGTIEALHQWATHNNGYVTLHTVDAYATINESILTVAPKPQNCCSYWRNDAIENAAIIADKYEQNYCAQDIRNMKRPIPAQQSPEFQRCGRGCVCIDTCLATSIFTNSNQQSTAVAAPDILDMTFYGNETLGSAVKMVDQSPRITEQDVRETAKDIFECVNVKSNPRIE